MADSSTQTIQIAAPAARVTEVICDFASYPGWVDAIKTVEVLSEYEDGYAHEVRFAVDAGMFADEYTLVYEYAADLSRIQWHLAAPSSVQKRQDGAYDIVGNADGTTDVTYTLSVDLAIPMLGMFKKKAERKILDTALREMKTRAEAR
ncbi:cyclase [Pilimelia terevasa]|uniref:Cyclase n=1 Tax=Pilimelia terevasa TaxID=53372 RepID=A0A8J3FHL8_9ACTN|nr:SRPBCC family protein [Pilimelia terevasa]GGK26468.1 cyclase [Pilimelia terevasa]